MKISKYVILLLSMIGGCSSEMAKRTTYETMENIRIDQCNRDFAGDCSGRESYGDYTRKREEVTK